MAVAWATGTLAAAAVTVGAAVASVALVAPESAVSLMFVLSVAVVVLADFAVPVVVFAVRSVPDLPVVWGRRVSFFDDAPDPVDDDEVLADDDFEPLDDEPESASAWATPVALASAAPTPSVIAAAPSHIDG